MSYWGTAPYCEASNYGGTSSYCETPNGAIPSAYGFARASIMAKSTIATAQKDTISDALFNRKLPFCGVALHDAEDRNNFVTMAQLHRYLEPVCRNSIIPL